MVMGWFSSGWAWPQAFGEHSVGRPIWFAPRPQSPGSEISVLSAMTDACAVAPDPLRAMSGQVATKEKPVRYVPRAFDFNHGLVWEDLTPADAGYATIRTERSSSARSGCVLRNLQLKGNQCAESSCGYWAFPL
jgi:hypothetical protein